MSAIQIFNKFSLSWEWLQISFVDLELVIVIGEFISRKYYEFYLNSIETVSDCHFFNTCGWNAVFICAQRWTALITMRIVWNVLKAVKRLKCWIEHQRSRLEWTGAFKCSFDRVGNELANFTILLSMFFFPVGFVRVNAV